MKQVILTGIKKMAMQEVPEPVVADPGDVKIKTAYPF